MRDVWPSRIGLGYLLAVLLLTLNTVLASWDAPHLRVLVGGDGSNSPGIALLALTGLMVLLLAARSRAGSRAQWHLVMALALWTTPVAVSLYLHGTFSDWRYWAMAAIVPALGAAAMLASPDQLRRTLLVLGLLLGWGSILVGISAALLQWPPVLPDRSERYGRWLAMVGPDLGQVPALNGVMLGRMYLGLSGGLLFVYALRVILGRAASRWWWLSSVGLVLAVLWSFSRTGLAIIVVGSLAALIPWERLKRSLLPFTVVLFVLLPLLTSAWLKNSGITDATTLYRFDLWRSLVSDPQVWMPFGIGPRQAVPEHAHQQVLEAQATGGWLAAAGCLAFIVLASLAAFRSAPQDHRAAIAVLFGMAVIFQLDGVSFASIYSVVNTSLVLIVAVLVSAAGYEASPEVARAGEARHGVQRP